MISFIVAVDNNFLIGNDNTLPWPKIHADMKHFRELTLGKTIVMGRKTFESLGKALPDRENIVLTRNTNFYAPNVTIYSNVQEVLKHPSKQGKLCIIGGAEIYKAFLPYVNRIYLTMIDESFTGDTYFPKKILDNFVLQDELKIAKDEKNPYNLVFKNYAIIEK
ncbi:MAG: dihydrofolate reductase [Candidatus Taylorbacteria bacterium]|nr:dihydrofolate reductase [Candidatus Taylorbacteria bacterium]